MLKTILLTGLVIMQDPIDPKIEKYLPSFTNKYIAYGVSGIQTLDEENEIGSEIVFYLKINKRQLFTNSIQRLTETITEHVCNAFDLCKFEKGFEFNNIDQIFKKCLEATFQSNSAAIDIYDQRDVFYKFIKNIYMDFLSKKKDLPRKIKEKMSNDKKAFLEKMRRKLSRIQDNQGSVQLNDLSNNVDDFIYREISKLKIEPNFLRLAILDIIRKKVRVDYEKDVDLCTNDLKHFFEKKNFVIKLNKIFKNSESEFILAEENKTWFWMTEKKKFLAEMKLEISSEGRRDEKIFKKKSSLCWVDFYEKYYNNIDVEEKDCSIQ